MLSSASCFLSRHPECSSVLHCSAVPILIVLITGNAISLYAKLVVFQFYLLYSGDMYILIRSYMIADLSGHGEAPILRR